MKQENIGMDLSMTDQLSVILLAVMASVGTAAVPGAGIIMLIIILETVHVPSAGIALILGVDRLLDMVRTAVNVSGDAVVSCIVAKGEGKFDTQEFNNANAGIFNDEELEFPGKKN